MRQFLVSKDLRHVQSDQLLVKRGFLHKGKRNLDDLEEHVLVGALEDSHGALRVQLQNQLLVPVLHRDEELLVEPVALLLLYPNLLRLKHKWV